MTGGTVGVLGAGPFHGRLLVLGHDLAGALAHPDRDVAGSAFAHHFPFGRVRLSGSISRLNERR